MREQTLGEALSEQRASVNNVFQSSLYSSYLIDTLKDMIVVERILNTNDVRNGANLYNSRNNKRKRK